MKPTVYLPIEEPPEGWEPFHSVGGRTAPEFVFHVSVLGPPLPTSPDLTPEARAVLGAAVRWRERNPGAVAGFELAAAVDAYAASLTPPDPLREAREALERAKRAVSFGGLAIPLADIEAALDRLAEKGGTA